jgi:RHS repeat-associated protein
MAHVFWDTDGQFPHQAPNSLIAMHLVMGDHLGSSSVVINHADSELVERTAYQPYGAVESDYRPSKGKAFREPYKFTGKEEDIEVGATYFGARYYQPYLGRFMSADPATIHGLGSDLNPYAYVGGRVISAVDPLGLRMDEVPCTGGESACFEIIDDKSQDSSTQADHGEAMASQVRERPAAVHEYLKPTPTNSWVPTPRSEDDIANDTESSAGGFRFPHVKRSTNREMIAKAYPERAPRIHAAERSDFFYEHIAPLTLMVVPGGQAEPLVLGEEAGLLRQAEAVLNAGSAPTRQTVSVLRTAESEILVGGGKRDLNPMQRALAESMGLTPVKLAGVDAEGTVLQGAVRLKLTPTFGVATRPICWVCERDIVEGAYGTGPGQITESGQGFSFSKGGE